MYEGTNPSLVNVPVFVRFARFSTFHDLSDIWRLERPERFCVLSCLDGLLWQVGRTALGTRNHGFTAVTLDGFTSVWTRNMVTHVHGRLNSVLSFTLMSVFCVYKPSGHFSMSTTNYESGQIIMAFLMYKEKV